MSQNRYCYTCPHTPVNSRITLHIVLDCCPEAKNLEEDSRGNTSPNAREQTAVPINCYWPLSRTVVVGMNDRDGDGGHVPKEAIEDLVRDLQKSRGTTILYTSHNMHEVERMCDRILFLSKGSIIATGTPIEVTRAILKEDRSAPALEEVFIRIAERQPREAVSN